MISFKIDMMIVTIKSYILNDLDPHSTSELHEKSKKFGVHFIDLDEIQHFATACWFVEGHAKFIS